MGRLRKDANSNGSVVTSEKRAARSARNVSERIAATLAKLDELRQLEVQEQRRQRQQLERIVARVIMSGIEDDPAIRATVGKVLTDRITRPAEREALQTWLMPLSQ